MPKRLLLITAFLLTLAACDGLYFATPTPSASPEPTIWMTNTAVAPTDEPTPTQESEFPGVGDKERLLPGEGFIIVNVNPLMEFSEAAVIYRYEEGVLVGQEVQWRPRGYGNYNLYRNLNGESGPEHHTNLVEIFDDGLGYQIPVSVWAGEAGYSEVVAIDQPGCYLVKVAGAHAVFDSKFAEHPYNYGVAAHLRSAVGNRSIDFQRWIFANLIANYEAFWTVWIGAAGNYEIRFGASVAYATAEPASDQHRLGSWIRLAVFAVALDEDGDHCNSNTPRI